VPVEKLGPNQMKVRVSNAMSVMAAAASFLRNAHGDLYSIRQAVTLEQSVEELRAVDAQIAVREPHDG